MNKEEIAALEHNIKAADTTGTFTSMKVKNVSVSAVIHRHAIGEDEDIGYVAYYHQNPIIHYWMNFNIWLRGKRRLWRQFLRTEEKK